MKTLDKVMYWIETHSNTFICILAGIVWLIIMFMIFSVVIKQKHILI